MNGSWIVWGEPAGRAWKVPIGGGTKVQLESAPTYIGDVALTATRAIWTVWGFTADWGSVRTVPLSGGTPSPLTTSKFSHGKAIAIDDQCVYFSIYGTYIEKVAL